MIIFETVLTQIIDTAPGVKSFRFKTDTGLIFKPGQFFFITLKSGGVERTKHFSFSNSPSEKDYVEFTKRLTGSDFSKALTGLKPGDWAKIKAPMGNFTFEGEHEKVAFLSGGIGITPIRSICKFACDKGISSDIILLYGNNTEADIIFKKDFDQMVGSNKNLKVVYTLTADGEGKNSWQGKTGMIDKRMIKEEIPDYGKRIFYVCGPPAMVSALKGMLIRDMAIEDKSIITENFTGY